MRKNEKTTNLTIGHRITEAENVVAGNIDVNLIFPNTDKIQIVSNVNGFTDAIIKTIYLRDNGTLEATTLKDAAYELLQKGRLGFHDLYKLNNYAKVALLTQEYLQDERNEVREYDFDWIMRFFEAVGNTSNEDLQCLWSKVLAGEIKKPKSCSFKTLDILHCLSSEEARSFNDLCQYVLYSGSLYFILSAGFDDSDVDCNRCIKERGMTYQDNIIPLIEHGLLSTDHDLATKFEVNAKLTIQNDNIVCIVDSEKMISKDNDKDGDDNTVFFEDAYFLTRSGVEIYNAIRGLRDYQEDLEYPYLCFKYIKQKYPQFNISAHFMEEAGEYNSVDLLQY